MNENILREMYLVGCGSGDTREIKAICDGMPYGQRDVLDAMNTFGTNFADTIGVNDGYEGDYEALHSKYTTDDLICLATYVAAVRSLTGEIY